MNMISSSGNNMYAPFLNKVKLYECVKTTKASFGYSYSPKVKFHGNQESTAESVWLEQVSGVLICLMMYKKHEFFT